MEGAREEYLAAGMDEYVSKPIEARRMLDLVERLTDVTPPAPAAKPARKTKAKPAEVPSIDEAHLESIRQVLPPRDFVQLISDFLDGAADRMMRIEGLLGSDDFQSLFREAHDMVSTSGNFGARRTEAAARRLEAAAKSQDRAAIAEAAVALKRESAEALAGIRERVMGVPA
jgi:HPt (histidine-containing phosphotransfer) domain-containing protein